MNTLTRWAWVAVLGTALALSWWSLDALGLRYGMPAVLAAMVSATFDGAALAAADLAMRHARAAESAAPVRLLMLAAVACSAWLNFEHGALLGYPVAVRVLFAAPPVVGGSLFELELRYAHRTRLRELGRVATPLPPFGGIVWALHPLMAFRRINAITASRIRSVPVTVMDWHTPATATEPIVPPQPEPTPPAAPVAPAAAPVPVPVPALASIPVPVAAGVPVRRSGNGVRSRNTVRAARVRRRSGNTLGTSARPGRGAPDEAWLPLARQVADVLGGMPSHRELKDRLAVGSDKAARLLPMLAADLLTLPTAAGHVGDVNGHHAPETA